LNVEASKATQTKPSFSSDILSSENFASLKGIPIIIVENENPKRLFSVITREPQNQVFFQE